MDASRKPSVTFRRHIQWLPDEEASEPTSTLVLTSPGLLYVDVRVLRCGPTSPIRSASEFLEDNCDGNGRVGAVTELEWAFAGTSFRTEQKGMKTHGTWAHWIDSRTSNVEDVVDEGVLEDILDEHGRILYELESGEMKNPSGVLQAYEEGWIDLPSTSINSNELKGKAKRQPDSGSLLADACIVLRTESQLRQIGGAPDRGMVIRAGQFIQGLLRQGQHLTVERWYQEDSGVAFKRLFKIGSGTLPCERLVNDRLLEPDAPSAITYGLVQWSVVEKSTS
ncbi:MAG: hypothetical protein M1828_001466 [Chrysothrix sp. TS-e1954]|nr:MAG: hypothetical protein M1828_001466 [Chrysothrix sp. TS-e1954]